ncbi:MAG: hypothetical protein SGARI_001769, partial [Bacillariaceae sp.]
MLSTLHDPFTRFLTPEQFESLTSTYASTSSSSSSSGIGVQLIGDANSSGGGGSGAVIVANVIANSPAEKSGILPGDVIRSMDGVDMMGATTEAVAAKCRAGESGSSVEVQVERRTRPHTNSNNDDSSAPTTSLLKFVVSRATLPSTPIVSSYSIEQQAVQQNGGGPSSSTSSSRRIGVLKINSFTKETEQKVQEQLRTFFEEESGGGTKSRSQSPPVVVTAVVLDLRGNLGGYMPGGVDVAKLFLPPRARIISV